MNILDATFALLDTETTGIDVKDPKTEVIEVAADLYNGRGELLDRFASLVLPVHPIPTSTSAVHHLVEEDLEGAPPRAQVDELLRAYLPAGVVPVAHNAAFDSALMADTVPGEWLCTNRMAHHLMQGLDWPRGFGLSTLLYTFGYRLRDIDLSDLASYRAVHSAPGDVRLLAPVFFHLIARYRAYAEEKCAGDVERLEKAEQVETLLEFTRRPYVMSKFPNFGKHADVALDAIPIDYFEWCLSPRGLTDMDADLRWNIQRELKRRGRAA